MLLFHTATYTYSKKQRKNGNVNASAHHKSRILYDKSMNHKVQHTTQH